jgi:hypothetical protein
MEQLASAVRRAWPAALSHAAGLAVLLAHHAAVFFPSWSDENIHLYVARRVAGAGAGEDDHLMRRRMARAISNIASDESHS